MVFCDSEAFLLVIIILQCWLPMEDCMCSRLVPCPLWCGIKFWLYMHPKVCLHYLLHALLSSLFFHCTPCRNIILYVSSFLQDFLRQNNTGKLLWLIFGIQAAPLCLFGIHEHEEIMWDAFRHSGLHLHLFELI